MKEEEIPKIGTQFLLIDSDGGANVNSITKPYRDDDYYRLNGPGGYTSCFDSYEEAFRSATSGCKWISIESIINLNACE